MSFGSPEPNAPHEFAVAIGRELDKGDKLMSGFYSKKFAILFPAEYAQFAPIMSAEILKRESK